MTEETTSGPRQGWVKRTLAFFGIVIGRGRRFPVALTKVFFFWVGGTAALGIASMVGMYRYSTQPAFCNSCHIMEPYYNAWKTSKHHGIATCVDCHYPPATTLTEHLWHKFQASSQVVKYVTRTYSSKPFAEIDNASCLRSGCHSTRLLEGEVVTPKGIKFDHRPHILETRRGRQLRCVSCHSQIVVGTHVEVTYSTCFLCHFRGQGEGAKAAPVGGCLGCHQLPTESFQVGNMTFNHADYVTKRGVACANCHLDVIQGEGKADQERCFTCHNQPEKLERYGDVAFIHEHHVTKHHVACLHCHQELRHGTAEFAGSGQQRLGEPPFPVTFLNKRHEPTLAFSCDFCHENKHTGQVEMYSGRAEVVDLPHIPSPMFEANVDCVGCHYKEEQAADEAEFTGSTLAAAPQACVKCHGIAFTGLWNDAKEIIRTTLGELAKKQQLVDAALRTASLTAEEGEQLKSMVAKADRWQRFVRLARGEHNIYLSAVALRKADAALSEVAQAVKATPPDLSTLPLLSGGYCATMCHQRLGVQVPPTTVTIDGKTMPHKAHTEMMNCVTCHELGGHKAVPLRADAKAQVCAGCHPE